MQPGPHTGQPVDLRQVLPDAEFFGAGDFGVTGCACDSRQVQPGDVFVALSGTAHDGHDFIDQAVARGAAGVIVARPVARPGLCGCRVADTADAYGRVCQALAGNPSRSLKVVGVTGTNGKTTTTCLIASILVKAGHRVGLLGTLEYFDGVDFGTSSHTTPPAGELAHWLARMVANGCSHAVMEVSSHALEQRRVAGVSFDAACVTNVRHDHLDYHGTLTNYRRAKAKLLRCLASEGFAVINADDPIAAGYLRELDGPVLTVGMHAAAEIAATLLEQCPSEQTFLLTAGSDAIPVRTRMIGLHHVSNCLVAAATGLAYGIDLPTVVRGLEAVECLPGRLQRIECGQPFSVFVDYAHTPDALTAVLQTLRAVTAGRVICVYGAGGDRDRDKRPRMAQAVDDAADLAVLTNDNPRQEDPQAIVNDLLSGVDDPTRVEVILDRAEAIGWALSLAQPGDCVLVAGKGHEGYQLIGQQRLVFDDAEVARAWLYQNQQAAGSGQQAVGSGQ
jgi:UDP-N-acetylmuramoyl-L-alanyl-D-glutamate--2,6-diaminopimelate ligase